MNNYVKLVTYFVLVSLLLIAGGLFIERGKLVEENHELVARLNRAEDMYRNVTGCDFVPPFFNPPLVFQTKDGFDIKVSVKHAFRDQKENAGTLNYQEKIDRLVETTKTIILFSTLRSLTTELPEIEAKIEQAYRSQYRESVDEFEIIQICTNN